MLNMMENKSALKHLLVKIYGALLLQLLTSSFLHAQTLIATIAVDDVQSAYVDRPGDLYILQKNNTLKKFDKEGKLLSEQVFQKAPTLFDPRDGARAFIYDQEKQQGSFYSEETKQNFTIELQYAIEPFLVCASGDHNIWIVDRSDWSLKRVNPTQSKVITEASIDQKQFNKTPEFLFIREYQNFLFLLEKNTGILIFNSLGNQIKKIPVTGISYLNFLGEELYYKKDDKLYFYDLFDASERQAPVDPACRFALVTDISTFLIYESKVNFFQNN
jgi:hypothetical protein